MYFKHIYTHVHTVCMYIRRCIHTYVHTYICSSILIFAVSLYVQYVYMSLYVLYVHTYSIRMYIRTYILVDRTFVVHTVNTHIHVCIHVCWLKELTYNCSLAFGPNSCNCSRSDCYRVCSVPRDTWDGDWAGCRCYARSLSLTVQCVADHISNISPRIVWVREGVKSHS